MGRVADGRAGGETETTRQTNQTDRQTDKMTGR